MTLSSVYFCEIKCPYKHKTILLWKVCTLWADLFVAYNLIYISIRNPKLSFFKTVGVSTTTQAEKSKKLVRVYKMMILEAFWTPCGIVKKHLWWWTYLLILRILWVIQKFDYFSDGNAFSHLLVFIIIFHHKWSWCLVFVYVVS